MKLVLLLLFCATTFSCQKSSTSEAGSNITRRDTIPHPETVVVPKVKPAAKHTVLVLPPFDLIANAGISPDIQEFLELEIAKDSSLTVIPFPLKKLMNVPYYNVFDKKYCSPILEKVPADIVVMSKLDNRRHTGNMESDGWDVSFRIFNAKKDLQKNSMVVIHNSRAEEIRKELTSRRVELIAEIQHTIQSE